MGILYFVETKMADQKSLLCRWVEHYYEQGLRAQVLTDSTLAAQSLDQLLWTFSQPSFIPHRIVGAPDGAAPREPVIITVGEAPVPGYPILLCDAPADLDFMGRFDLAIHFVVIDDEARRQASRDLWQSGKERGLDLRHMKPAKQADPPALVPSERRSEGAGAVVK